MMGCERFLEDPLWAPDVLGVLVCGSVTPVKQGKHPFTTVLAARAWPRSENFLAN